MNRKGLSFTETCIIAAVSAILAAIFFPLLKHAGQYAKSDRCKSRFDLLAQAFSIYASDHDGWTPLADKPTILYTFTTVPDITMYSCPLLEGEAQKVALSELGPTLPLCTAFNRAALGKRWQPDEKTILAGDCLNESGIFSDPDELAYVHRDEGAISGTIVVMASGNARTMLRSQLTNFFPLEMTYKRLPPGSYDLLGLHNQGAKLDVDEFGHQIILVPE